jgi:hypothetical protein
VLFAREHFIANTSEHKASNSSAQECKFFVVGRSTTLLSLSLAPKSIIGREGAAGKERMTAIT